MSALILKRKKGILEQNCAVENENKLLIFKPQPYNMVIFTKSKMH